MRGCLAWDTRKGGFQRRNEESRGINVVDRMEITPWPKGEAASMICDKKERKELFEIMRCGISPSYLFRYVFSFPHSDNAIADLGSHKSAGDGCVDGFVYGPYQPPGFQVLRINEGHSA